MRQKYASFAVSAVIFFLSIALGIVDVAAQETVKITAVGRVDYSSFSSDTKTQALEEAKKTALKKFAAKFPTARKSQLKSFEREFYANVNDFVIEAKIQQEKKDDSIKVYSVAIVATVDTAAVDAFFIDNSAAGNQLVGDASDFGVMFIARYEVSRRSFEVKQSTVKESNNSAILQEESASDGTTSLDSTNSKSIEVERTGGSSERKRDKVTYEPSLEASENVAYAVEEHLVNAGFEPMGIDELDNVPFLDEIVDKMRKSGRLPKRIEKAFKRAATDAGWTFLGIGTIDIGTPQQDLARGTVRVPATVAFKVWMLTDGRAKTVASVRPQAVYGEDRGDASVAETNAYNDAVKLALDTVVAQLQKKGLR